MQAIRRRRLLRCGQCFDVDVGDAAEALPPDHLGRWAWLHMSWQDIADRLDTVRIYVTEFLTLPLTLP